MDNYDYLEKLYAFASENGYKVKNLNVNERRNQRGRYDYVELALVIPREPARKLEKIIAEIEDGLEKDNEVNNDEI